MWKVSRGISGQSHETDAGDGERGACGMHASFCGRSKHSGVHVDACRVHKPDLDYHPTVQWRARGAGDEMPAVTLRLRAKRAVAFRVKLQVTSGTESVEN